ncbi:hypothetical protein B484DRAFT_407194, partial [Ochromonadaceae sp. CCMP2298]
MQAVGKRRLALADITNNAARETKKQINDFYTVWRGVEETLEKMKYRSERAKKAVQSRISKFAPAAAPRDGVVVVLMKQLKISAGSSAEAKKVLYDSLKATKEKPFDPCAGNKGRGRTPHIVDLTPQAGVVNKSLEQGLSTNQR